MNTRAMVASLLLALTACRMDARQQAAQMDTSTVRHMDAQQVVVESDPSAARAFARAFYDWYVPKVLSGPPSLDLALRERPNLFSDSLRRALAVDSLARSRAVGEIDVCQVEGDEFGQSQA